MITTAALLLASAPALATVADELLPETPAGWRFEKLDLPLSFAPDLPYEGFEELRFAPGMFDAEAPDFWSYVLALRTSAPIDFDAPRIEEFLIAYYGGLCEAVAGGRGVDFDRKSLKLALEDHGDMYVATIDMIDPFVTGGPLTLRLELSVLPGPSTSELFGIASPADTDAAVWKKLRAVRDRWRAARASAVLLNHLFIVPDAETYAALRDSPFLKNGFAVREERTTVRPDLTYSGLYFYGRDTYFEFLEPGSVASLSEGAGGIALGLERPGGTQELKSKLTTAGIQCFDGPRARRLGDMEVPWFQIMGLAQAHERSRLQLFTMEYDPAFLDGWHPSAPPEHGGIARRQVLARYAAQLEQQEVHTTGLVLNVSEVFLELDEAERKRFLTACEVFGHAISEEADVWVCKGPQISVAVRASDGPGRITGFRLALRRSVERKTIELGRARLQLQGKTATFLF